MNPQNNSKQIPDYILVDGSSYLYRAFYGLPPLSSSNGEPTWVIRGVISMLKKLKKDYPKSHVVTIFDAKGKTFRHELYSEYKANRPPMPEDLRVQIEPLHKIIKAMGLKIISQEGVEADDIIGTLAKKITEENGFVVISTGDKDMAQLVNKQVILIDTMKNILLNEGGVKEKFGVPPCMIIDLLALEGDKSDNIPGVPSVGKKTALSLLNSVGDIKAIYKNLEKVSVLKIRGAKSLAEKLKEHQDKAFLSYELATIKTDVEFETPIESLVEKSPDYDLLKEFYNKLEFKTWLKELNNQQSGNVEPVNLNAEYKYKEPEYNTILSESLFMEQVNKIQAAKCFAFDTETTSLNYMEAELVGISFAVESGKAFYVPVAHCYENAPKQLDRNWVLSKLKNILESDTVLKIGQNIKYDKNILARYGINLKGMAFDTMLESYVLHSTAIRHNMDSLAKYYLNLDTIKYEDVAGKGVKQISFDKINIKEASEYAAEDAYVTKELHSVISEKLNENATLKKVYETIERPLIEILSGMEQRGTMIDSNLLNEQTIKLKARITDLENEVWELAGEQFNPNSPKQLQHILFDLHKLPIVKKTPKGQPSTAEEVLSELALNYPLPAKILEFRSLSKLCSTYTEKLPKMVCPHTQRLHTSFHQAVTATGRLSSTDPNLQNIPIKTAEGRKIRQAFIAKPNYKIIAADYSQIELRIMAHLSQDKNLINAFVQGLDVHTATAAEVLGIPIENVTKEQRRSAKAINFGLIYGMSAFGLAKQLGISRGAAQSYIDQYFIRYPQVKEYMDTVKTIAKRQGFVETICGRRLYLAEINNKNVIRRQAAERTAINAPMQGSAADIIKLAMINIHKWLESTNFDVVMTIQVHDELVFEVHKSVAIKAKELIIQKMSEVLKLSVPLVVDAAIGDNWDQAH